MVIESLLVDEVFPPPQERFHYTGSSRGRLPLPSPDVRKMVDEAAGHLRVFFFILFSYWDGHPCHGSSHSHAVDAPLWVQLASVEAMWISSISYVCYEGRSGFGVPK